MKLPERQENVYRDALLPFQHLAFRFSWRHQSDSAVGSFLNAVDVYLRLSPEEGGAKCNNIKL